MISAAPPLAHATAAPAEPVRDKARVIRTFCYIFDIAFVTEAPGPVSEEIFDSGMSPSASGAQAVAAVTWAGSILRELPRCGISLSFYHGCEEWGSELSGAR